MGARFTAARPRYISVASLPVAICPMAAMAGLLQKLGTFQIRVKPDMCISCGNCTTYCEMGIDVRAYAQRNESFTRAACVGCGMCAHVCPRGVLRLESASR